MEKDGIKVLPVDFNNNGVIDDNEYFYQVKDSLKNAILWTGDFLLACQGFIYNQQRQTNRYVTLHF